jgi:hypothetical protein
LYKRSSNCKSPKSSTSPSPNLNLFFGYSLLFFKFLSDKTRKAIILLLKNIEKYFFN